MRRLCVVLAAALLVAGCATADPTYRGPDQADQNAAIVAIGPVAEDHSESQNNSWISITAVDGEPTGLTPAVRVAPGEHRITVRHIDPYATFYGNVRYGSVTFKTEAGGRYRIDGDYCCGFVFGRLKLAVVDEASGEQIAKSDAKAQ